jgi:hypothetical protein
MRTLAALTLLALPLAASAGQRRQSFGVHATVIRSTRLEISARPGEPARLRVSRGQPVAVQAGDAPPRIESALETALPAGTSVVTVNY